MCISDKSYQNSMNFVGSMNVLPFGGNHWATLYKVLVKLSALEQLYNEPIMIEASKLKL